MHPTATVFRVRGVIGPFYCDDLRAGVASGYRTRSVALFEYDEAPTPLYACTR